MITQRFNLNMIPESAPVIVKCDQYDVGEGRLVASLFNGDLAYTPASGATAVIQGTKPDKRGFAYDATISGSTVTADLKQQMTAVPGKFPVNIIITESGNRTGTFDFWLDVQPAALADDTDMSDTEIPAYIEGAEQAAQRAESAAASAEGDASDAEAYAAGTRNRQAVASDDPAYHNNAGYYAGQASGSASDALDSKNAAAQSETNALASERAAAQSETNAVASATAASGSATAAAGDAVKAKSWAVGPSGSGTSGTDIDNAKYWAQQAQQYAQGGMIFKGSISYANIPVSGQQNGDMYDINEAFVTDSRFIEGAGVKCVAGTDIVWIATASKWNILTPVGVMIGATSSTAGAAGIVPAPAAGDEDKVLKGDGTWDDSGGHTIVTPSGNTVPQRSRLQFYGNGVYSVTDSESDDETSVHIPGLGKKLSSTVSGNTLEFTDGSISGLSGNNIIDGPYIKDVLAGITSVAVNGNTVTFTLNNSDANGKAAFIWVRNYNH